ncbi:hypothetical protein [Mesorhizobium hawassense]|uniref:hypothetical protein n=1 Tax=Mesorhizobium hawassense TaxID=1209954 RepID=UPI00142D7898|nr:hypothetical protein [Mesorhizobium hawassense]
MDVRIFIGSLSAALLRRRAAMPPVPVRVIRASLAEVPLRPRPRPPHRPAPPIRPASNM